MTERLWHALSGDLHGWLGKRLSDPVAVEDLHQEVFLRVHQGLPGLADRDRVVPWVYTVARNVLVDHYRKRPEAPLPADLIAPEPAPLDQSAEVASWLPAMVEALPEPYREAMRLSELQGLSQKEVAGVLGLSPSGARTRVQRGRRLLREALLACCAIQREGTVVTGWQPNTCTSC